MISNGFQIAQFFGNGMPSAKSGNGSGSSGGFSDMLSQLFGGDGSAWQKAGLTAVKGHGLDTGPENANARSLMARLRQALATGGVGKSGIDGLPGDGADTVGAAFLHRLRQALLAMGGKSGSLEISDEGLGAFKKMLLAAGYSAEQVNRFFDGLSNKADGDRITLSELAEKMKVFEEDEIDSTELLPISALPFIEVILSKLGLGRDAVENVLSGDVVSKDGIDIRQLILRIRAESRQNGSSAPLVNKEAGAVGELMAAMGLETGDAETAGEMTLEKFAAMLESRLQSKSSGIKDNDGMITALDRFLANVKDADKNAITASAEDRFRRMMPNRTVKNEDGAFDPTKTVDMKTAKGMEIAPDGVRTTEKAAHIPVHQKTDENFMARLFQDAGIPGRGAEKEAGVAAMKESGDWLDMADKRKDSQKQQATVLSDSVRASLKAEDGQAANAKPSAGRALPGYVLNQVGRQVLRTLQQGGNEIHLQLKPPHLGRIHLSLETLHDGLRISIVTEQQATREMLASHSTELRNLLMEQGVRLEKIDVQIAFNFDQHMAQTRQDSRKSSGQQSGFQMDEDAEESGTVRPAQSVAGAPRRGLLDLVA